ncbi:DUF1311 domain-containing protein [Erythrobacter sp. JK5]|nr:DUF1311 domain-containing protein [Erythrobacter sp. JK5]
MKSDKPEPQELVFRFERMGEPGRTICPDSTTTLDMNQCYADIATASDERRKRYFDAAIARETESAAETERMLGETEPDTQHIAQMRASETAFEAYREAECGAVWESWKTGTIRTIMALGCQIELTDRRTHTIWQNWLTYMDSTPPTLPEPMPSR